MDRWKDAHYRLFLWGDALQAKCQQLSDEGIGQIPLEPQEKADPADILIPAYPNQFLYYKPQDVVQLKAAVIIYYRSHREQRCLFISWQIH